MNKFNFIIIIGIIFISLCIFFACEQTVENSGDDDTNSTSSVSSVVSSASSTDSSETTSSAASSESSAESSSSEISSETTSSSGYVLFDNFNSYSSASPWMPEGGWAKMNSAEWSIVPGYDGNGVQSDSIIREGIIYLSYTGSNCTVSAKSRATTISDAYGYGLLLQTSSPYYVLHICYFSSGNNTVVEIYKNGTSVATQIYKTGQLSTSTYYTLSLSVTGTTDPVITGNITDGTTSQSVNYTDTGINLGSSNYIGIYSGGAASIIYDDFTVTEP